MFWHEKKEEDILLAQRTREQRSWKTDCEKNGNKWFVPVVVSILCITVVVCFLSLSNIARNKDQHVDVEEVDIPKNGTVFYPFSYNNPDYETITAPLTIKTKGDGYYYVKLKDSETEKNELIFFVHGGESVELNVPEGDYLLYYAHGEKWYGTSDLFGPDTMYSKADEVFDFHEDENGDLLGWTVELYLQRDGNLSVEAIDDDDF